MKPLRDIIFFPKDANPAFRTPHLIWVGLGVTGLGCCIGFLTLFMAATAYGKLDGVALFLSYLKNPLLLGMNLLLPVVLAWLFYFLSGMAWVGYLGSAIPCMAVALVNYYKIRLRGDPLLGADILLASEAGDMMGHYTLDVTWVTAAMAACFAAGLLFAVLFLPRGMKGRKVRLLGALVCVLLAGFSLVSLYPSQNIYKKTANTAHINPWSDVEVFVSRGVLYPFLYSLQDMIPQPPEGYDPNTAQALLEQYTDGVIPAGEKVDVVGVMLEAFCDLTDFEALAAQSGVQEIYAPWHRMEEQSVSGDLLTNIFAGGTVDSEWCFLTGYSQYDQFRSPTDSYLWYLRGQGYDAQFHHPGYGWFYNRQNVNLYLGFRESFFTDNRYAQFVDPLGAVYHSDHIVVEQIMQDLEQKGDVPLFSFTVTYQNHGPYADTPGAPEVVTPAGSGWSEGSCNIINSYLKGVSHTILQMEHLLAQLEEREEPTVAVLFGDHKPWMGNGDSAYAEVGANFDISTMKGFKEYYATPYLIWANSAAKEVLGNDFVGEGGDFSPCFLMTKLFDLCGWEGDRFMQLSRQMRDISPLIHARGLFLTDGTLTDTLPEEQMQFYREYLWAQYYREKEIDPKI